MDQSPGKIQTGPYDRNGDRFEVIVIGKDSYSSGGAVRVTTKGWSVPLEQLERARAKTSNQNKNEP